MSSMISSTCLPSSPPAALDVVHRPLEAIHQLLPLLVAARRRQRRHAAHLDGIGRPRGGPERQRRGERDSRQQLVVLNPGHPLASLIGGYEGDDSHRRTWSFRRRPTSGPAGGGAVILLRDPCSAFIPAMAPGPGWGAESDFPPAGPHICNQSLIMSCRLVSNSDLVPLTLFCPTSST